MIRRGEVYWADLGETQRSRPAKRHPILVIQADVYNESRLATVLAAVITSNTALATMPGNAFLSSSDTGLARDSVVNVTALITLDKHDLDDRVGTVPAHVMTDVDRGLRAILAL